MVMTAQPGIGAVKFIISPQVYHAVIFDLDGVVTQTAKLHASAWKALFDSYLLERSKRENVSYQPFDSKIDYLEYLDGKPRYEGIQSFLQSRNIHLPYGTPDDSPEMETIIGLGNSKNIYFQQILREQGIEIYHSTVALIHQLRNEKVKTAIISSSKNCTIILEKAGLLDLFDVKIDGLETEKLNIPGKPAPDIFIEAARRLGVEPERSMIVEDAIAGVQAGKAGNFKLVIGVDRGNHADRLKASGADIVVNDLSEIKVGVSNIFEEATGGQGKLGFTTRARDYWCLEYQHFDPEKEGLRESLCALGNGYFVTRAAIPESTDDDIHYPGTYIAGIYNQLTTEVAGRLIHHEDLVNIPNWLALTFRIENGEWFNLKAVEILAYHQELNVKEGVFHRNIRFRDTHNRVTRLKEQRLVHMRHFHLGAIELQLTAENWSGRMEVQSALDGRVVNNNVARYWYLNKKHLEPLESNILPDGLLYLKMQTNQSKIQIALAARTSLHWSNGHPVHLEDDVIHDVDYVAQQYALNMTHGDTLIIEKVAAIYTSRDPAISESGLEAREAAQYAPDFSTLLDSHVESWQHLWELCDITVQAQDNNGGFPTALILHLHLFHLMQTVSLNSIDLDIGIPARGWHGEGYRGHIFWDDLFVFPFLTFRKPEISEALLKYRYRRLDKARLHAHEEGLAGALFPWQSASNGREQTPRYHLNIEKNSWIPENTFYQKHVNAAIVYNIWQYYQITGDIEFLNSYGGEIILEIARMFASLSTYNANIDRYEIRGIMGPDEYHDGYGDQRGSGINNNAYTNLMVVWVLCRSLEILEILPSDRRKALCERLNLKPQEITRWEEISRKMKVILLPDGIISQFEGYEELQEFPKDYSVKQMLNETGGTLNHYKMSKQADVLMLFYLFSSKELKELFDRLDYPFDPAWIPKNIEYYLSRTAHGSTLSRVVHAWVLSRADRHRSWKLFQEALQSDVSDIQGGTTPEGIHIGAMAGTVDIIQRCYTGLVTRNEILWLNPCLPAPLQNMSFCIHYRKQSLRIELTRDRLQIMARYSAAEPIRIGFNGRVFDLHAGETQEFDLPDGGCLL